MQAKLFGDAIEPGLSKHVTCSLRPEGHCYKANFGSCFLEAAPEEVMNGQRPNFEPIESTHIWRVEGL